MSATLIYLQVALLLSSIGACGGLMCHVCKNTHVGAVMDRDSNAGCGESFDAADTSIKQVQCPMVCYKSYSYTTHGGIPIETWTRGCAGCTDEHVGANNNYWMKCCSGDLCNVASLPASRVASLLVVGALTGLGTLLW